ncbi:MAG: hypothetical protein R3C10_18600 [Pirellulales bacterium]
MQQTRQKIVAVFAASALLLQAWLGATHVHPHGAATCHHAGGTAVCCSHEHDAHTHPSHDEHAEHAHAGHCVEGHCVEGHCVAGRSAAGQTDNGSPASEQDQHDSSHCQICQLLAQRPLPQATTVELTGGVPVAEAIVFAVALPSTRPERLFLSRAPPTLTV